MAARRKKATRRRAVRRKVVRSPPVKYFGLKKEEIELVILIGVTFLLLGMITL